jgi:hypothetical protein
MATRSGRQVRRPAPREALTLAELREVQERHTSAEPLDESSTSYEDDMGTLSDLEEGVGSALREGGGSVLDLLKSIPGTQMVSEDEETEDEIDKGRCGFDYLAQPTA